MTDIDRKWEAYLNSLGIESGNGTKSKREKSNGYDYTNRNGYYVPGMGYFQNEPLVERDENGQRVVTTAGVQRVGKLTKDGGLDRNSSDRLHPSYDKAKAATSDALKRWNESRTEQEEQAALMQLWQAYQNTGDFTGSFDDFVTWFKGRAANMTDGLMNVQALHNSRGVATNTADERAINRNGSNGGFNSSSRVSGAYRSGSGYAW